MPAEKVDRPSLPETAAVLAALQAYLTTRYGTSHDASDLRLDLAHLKESIARVEAVTASEEDR